MLILVDITLWGHLAKLRKTVPGLKFPIQIFKPWLLGLHLHTGPLFSQNYGLALSVRSTANQPADYTIIPGV